MTRAVIFSEEVAAERPVAVVTGAAGLIGSEVAAQFRARDVSVIGIDNATVGTQPGEWLKVDVTSQAAVRDAADRIATSYERVDYFVHAAGLTGRAVGRTISGDLESVSLSLWDELFRANVTSALLCVQALLPLLRRSSRPAVLLLGSIQGLVPTFQSGAYAVTKTALIGLTRQLASELATDGITVNMVAPGPTIASSNIERATSENEVGAGVVRRFNSATEVAAAVVTLAMSESFRNMTGTVVPVDGGEHLRARLAPTMS